jgi:hypothetical protein
VSVTFTYRLTGFGWSESTLVIGEHRAMLTASYLSDALGELLGAVVRIVEGEPEATASFTEEPGEFRWRMFRVGSDRLLVRILDFAGIWGNRLDEEGKPILEGECRLRTFAGAVLSASQRLLEEHGCEGYREKWRHEFPLSRQEKLQHLLHR